MGVAAYWLLGEDAQAERLYTRVETLPDMLERLTDPLPRAVLAAFRSRRACIALTRNQRRSSSGQVNHQTILKLCDTAGQLLDESITFMSCQPPSSIVLVRYFSQI